jgi:SAM-dependent methyltransferase
VKLNLGCGDHIIDGWVNADVNLAAMGEGAVLLDLYHPTLPWDDDTFDQVLMSHTLEHIPLEDGLYVTDPALWVYDKSGDRVEICTVQSVLAEVRRVLEPGGALLAIGPDFNRVLSFFLNISDGVIAEGAPWEREDRWYHLLGQATPMLREGAIEDWYQAYMDDREMDPSPWKEAGPFTATDVEMLVGSILSVILDGVFENHPYLPHNDHRWNCCESRMLALVGEHFDKAKTVSGPAASVWVDENMREWQTRSWGMLNCAVLAQ